jgi:hydrogenase maturation protease
MTAVAADVLLLCYGNPGRRDDGLGAAFAAAVGDRCLPGVTLEVDYQLNVELAVDLAQHAYAVFVDAAVGGREPFSFRVLEPGPVASFSTHSVQPAGLLGVARQFFGSMPEAYALGIRGYHFDLFDEALSPGAAGNLAAAVQFMLPVLAKRSFAEAAAALGTAAPEGGGG